MGVGGEGGVGMGVGGGSAEGGGGGVGLADVGTTTQELVGGVSDNQQVFTVDTGVGNCDTVGMPTLADATLAEAAAKLQQVCYYILHLWCTYVHVFLDSTRPAKLL